MAKTFTLSETCSYRRRSDQHDQQGVVMTVHANLSGPDLQTVLCMRTCVCPCRPEMQLYLDEREEPIHQLDLARLSELSDLMPIARACSYCGSETTAIWRIAAVLPAENWLRALVHVRNGNEQAYALVDRAESEDPASAAETILRNLPEDEYRQQVAPDELTLLRQWERPLSTRAFVRSAFADFLASGKTARTICLGNGSIAYQFARRNDDAPTEAETAALVAKLWHIDPESLLFADIASESVDPESVVRGIGELASFPGTATIIGLADAHVVEHDLREAVQAHGLLCLGTEGELPNTALLFGDGKVATSLPLRSVAHEAIQKGRTLAEAADLAVERLTYMFTAVHNGQITLTELGACRAPLPDTGTGQRD
jgi:hypothetical protein